MTSKKKTNGQKNGYDIVHDSQKQTVQAVINGA